MPNSEIANTDAYLTTTDVNHQRIEIEPDEPLHLYKGHADISIGPYYASNAANTSHISLGSEIHLHFNGRDGKKQVREIPSESLDTRIKLGVDGVIFAEGKPEFTLYSVADTETAGEGQSVPPSETSAVRK
jgi:hypothetical protein